MKYKIYDTLDGRDIDNGLTLEQAIDMLKYYVARQISNRWSRCTYGILPELL